MAMDVNIVFNYIYDGLFMHGGALRGTFYYPPDVRGSIDRLNV